MFSIYALAKGFSCLMVTIFDMKNIKIKYQIKYQPVSSVETISIAQLTLSNLIAWRNMTMFTTEPNSPGTLHAMKVSSETFFVVELTSFRRATGINKPLEIMTGNAEVLGTFQFYDTCLCVFSANEQVLA